MIFFFHCHKAGGSTVVKAAQEGGMTLPPNHANGNVTEADGSLIRWDALSDEAATERLQTLSDQGVNFLAFEFSMPSLKVLSRFEQARHVAVLREPLARMYSNFKMDVAQDYIALDGVFGIDSYVRTADADYRSNNYYIRFFCRLGPNEPVRPEHLTYTLALLKGFDVVGVLETAPLAADLQAIGLPFDDAGWTNSTAKSTKFQTAAARMSALSLDSYPVSPDFIEANRYDYALYSYFMQQAMKRGLTRRG